MYWRKGFFINLIEIDTTQTNLSLTWVVKLTIILAKVVLPDPEIPTKATLEPCGMVKIDI